MFSPAPRYGGTGYAGSSSLQAPNAGSYYRPPIARQDSAPPEASLGLNSLSSTAIAAARAAELVNGNHTQHTINLPNGSGSQHRPGIPISNSSGALQATRPAPPRPLLAAGRPAPQPSKPPVPEHTPSSADLRSRAKAHGPNDGSAPEKPPGIAASTSADQQIPLRKESLATNGVGSPSGPRPNVAPSKSSPAVSNPATHPAPGAAGSVVGPPPVKPLQTNKKLPKDNGVITKENDGFAITVTGADEQAGGVAAAAAALEKPMEKPKEKERRISTMTEGQIMDKLRSVVCPDDPRTLFSKIKKVGQG